MTLPNGDEFGHLVTVDSDPLDLYASSISMAELKIISQRSIAKHILFLVDATYGGISRIGNEENVSTDSQAA